MNAAREHLTFTLGPRFREKAHALSIGDQQVALLKAEIGNRLIEQRDAFSLLRFRLKTLSEQGLEPIEIEVLAQRRQNKPDRVNLVDLATPRLDNAVLNNWVEFFELPLGREL